MNLLQAAYCLVVVGVLIVMAIADPVTAIYVVAGFALIFGAYVGLEWIFGSRK